MVRTTNDHMPDDDTNNHMRTGVIDAIMSKLVRRPILSEIGPAANVPMAPENCKIDNDAPLIQSDAPRSLIKVGRNVVNADFMIERKNVIAKSTRKKRKRSRGMPVLFFLFCDGTE